MAESTFASVSDVSLTGYAARVMAGFAPRFEPDDIDAGTLRGASSAQRRSHDHRRLGAQPAQPPAHTNPDIQALADSGIRAMFLWGGPGQSAQTDGVNADYSDEAKRLREGPFSSGQHGLLRLGLALRGDAGGERRRMATNSPTPNWASSRPVEVRSRLPLCRSVHGFGNFPVLGRASRHPRWNRCRPCRQFGNRPVLRDAHSPRSRKVARECAFNIATHRRQRCAVWSSRRLRVATLGAGAAALLTGQTWSALNPYRHGRRPFLNELATNEAQHRESPRDSGAARAGRSRLACMNG